MSDKKHELLSQALTLSPEERMDLAERILSSLGEAFRSRIDDLWAVEAEERIDAFERGEIRTISSEEFFLPKI